MVNPDLKSGEKARKRSRLRHSGDGIKPNRGSAASKVRIVHLFSPVVVTVDSSNFSSLVQRLTGKPEQDPPNHPANPDYAPPNHPPPKRFRASSPSSVLPPHNACADDSPFPIWEKSSASSAAFYSSPSIFTPASDIDQISSPHQSAESSLHPEDQRSPCGSSLSHADEDRFASGEPPFFLGQDRFPHLQHAGRPCFFLDEGRFLQPASQASFESLHGESFLAGRASSGACHDALPASEYLSNSLLDEESLSRSGNQTSSVAVSSPDPASDLDDEHNAVYRECLMEVEEEDLAWLQMLEFICP